jgi:hypothetical protein
LSVLEFPISAQLLLLHLAYSPASQAVGRYIYTIVSFACHLLFRRHCHAVVWQTATVHSCGDTDAVGPPLLAANNATAIGPHFVGVGIKLTIEYKHYSNTTTKIALGCIQ